MMFTNTIVAAAALAASVVTAAPSPAQPPTATIKLCNDFNWNQCREISYAPRVCTEATHDLHDVISSLETYNKQCTFFVDSRCSTQTGSFYWKGDVQNIRDHPDLGRFENSISSFQCEP